MQQVYRQGLWGANGRPFYSGHGSHQNTIVQPYVKIVSQFLKSFKFKPTLVDLGCGDFNVGRQLLPSVGQYFAVDIVPELIRYNVKTYQQKNLSFLSLNIASDPLPKAQIAMVRQVLQHISNAEILQLLPKLQQYQHLVVTEHLPLGNFTPNKDIISGQGIRLKQQSGVVLTAPPFNLKVQTQQILLTQKQEAYQGVLQTVLYHI